MYVGAVYCYISADVVSYTRIVFRSLSARLQTGFNEESEVSYGMRWFYMILATAVIAGVAIAVERLTNVLGHQTLQLIVAASMMVIFVALIKFVSKLHD